MSLQQRYIEVSLYFIPIWKYIYQYMSIWGAMDSVEVVLDAGPGISEVGEAGKLFVPPKLRSSRTL